MNQPVVFKRSLAIAMITMLQAFGPALIVIFSLYAISTVQKGEFDQFFVALAALAGVLSLVILVPQRNGSPILATRRTVVAFDLLIRWGLLLVVLLGLGYLTGFSAEYARRVVIPWALLTPLALIPCSLFLNALMRRAVLSRENLRTAVIAGFNESSLSLARRLVNNPELCTRMLGFFDDRGNDRLGDMEGHAHLGRLTDVANYVRARQIDVIFIALPMRHVQRVIDLLDDLRDTTASLYYVPDIFVFDLIQSRTSEVMGIPVVAMCETPFHGYRGVVKRLTDVLFTLGIMVVALPLMLLIGILVKLTSSGPAIFKQRRYGLDGREIVVYKFRTMRVTEDGAYVAQAKKDDPRITPIGQVLRRFSLDELPQLINVLQGKMSLVGPRPHAVAHNEEYRQLIKGYMMRHKVLPGITGLAQVNGCRGETAELAQMQARVNYDLDYLRNWTPVLDLKIILLTAVKVFWDKRAY
jgi:putative colanic acid biosysnthesis UDP-glucose lipid carrier transferase